jgi:hypothetical protein
VGGGNGYTRECTECRHTVRIPLPQIRKRVIYLDQFLISNITKALDPEARSHARVLEQPFWLEVFKRLDILIKLQLLVCPDSMFHTDESLLSGDPSYKSLRDVYEHLSGGNTFYDHNTITRFQVHRQFENYLAGNPDEPLELVAERVMHGNPHEWRGRLRVGVDMKPFPGQLEAIHKERDTQYEGLKSVFERWQKEKGRDFMEWVREEAYGFGKGTFLAHRAYLQRQMEIPQKYAEEYLAGKEPDVSLEDIFPPASSELINDLMRTVSMQGFSGEEAFKKMAEYLFSKYLVDIPTVHISSLLYAGIARKAAHGQKAYPNKGTFTDVNAIASLLPYCDAVFIDNGMAALLREHPIDEEMRKYPARVFSPNTKEEFLSYLDEIRTSADAHHLEIVADYYGEAKPYLGLLSHRREQEEMEKLADDI